MEDLKILITKLLETTNYKIFNPLRYNNLKIKINKKFHPEKIVYYTIYQDCSFWHKPLKKWLDIHRELIDLAID